MPDELAQQAQSPGLLRLDAIERLLREAMKKREVDTSATLIAELADVLAREKSVERITRIGSAIADLLAGYRARVRAQNLKAAPFGHTPDQREPANS